jgi:protocatechuate 4,5-dioxygenase alpha chain
VLGYTILYSFSNAKFCRRPRLADSNRKLPVPLFDLEPPGTFLYTGAASSRGHCLNRFALSLRDAASRQQFLANPIPYFERYEVPNNVRALIDARDWSGLLREGGHLQAILKIAATLGQDLYDIGAHNVGVDRGTLYENCPRRVFGLGDLDG